MLFFKASGSLCSQIISTSALISLSNNNGSAIAVIIALVLPNCLIPVIICRLFAWILLFHLSYYSISHRIGILTSFIQSLKGKTNSSLRVKRFRTCGYIFDQICLATNNINATFSFIMLINFTMLICISTTSIFFIIYAMSSVKIPLIITNQFLSFVGIFGLSNVMILLFLSSAESSTKEVLIYLIFCSFRKNNSFRLYLSDETITRNDYGSLIRRPTRNE